MPLNINYAGDGRGIAQANENIDSSRAFGNRTKDVMSVPQAVRGQFGDYSGDIAMGQSLSRVAAVLDDVVVRENNLKIANETARRKLHEQELKEASFKARQQVEETSQIQELTADDREQLYHQLLDGNVSDVNSKYKYTTPVGNDIDAWIERETSSYKLDYKSRVVEGYRVQEFKVAQQKAWDKGVGNLITDYKMNGDPNSVLQGLQQLSADLDRPEFQAAMGGPEKAYAVKTSMVDKALKDVLTAMPFKDQRDLLDTTVSMVDPNTGKTVSVVKRPEEDLLSWMDPTARQSLFKQADRLYSQELSAISKATNEAREEQGQRYIAMLEVAGNDPKKIQEVQRTMMDFLGVYETGSEAEKAQMPLSFRQVNQILARANDTIEKTTRNNLRAAELSIRKQEIRAAKEAKAAEKEAEQNEKYFAGNTAQVNAEYARRLKDMGPVNAAMSIVEETGVYPPNAQANLQRQLSSKDPQKVNEAKMHLDYLLDNNALAYGKLGKDLRNLHGRLESMDVEAAQEYTMRELQGRDVGPSTRVLNDEVESINFESEIADRFSTKPWMQTNTKVPPQAASELKEAYVNNRKGGMSQEVALSRAATVLATKWGTSDFNGSQVLVKNPVEKMYGQKNYDAKLVKEQMASDFKEQFPGLDPNDYVPMYSGKHPKSGLPSYRFVHKETGEPVSKQSWSLDGDKYNRQREARDAEIAKKNLEAAQLRLQEQAKTKSFSDWEKFKREDSRLTGKKDFKGKQ